MQSFTIEEIKKIYQPWKESGKYSVNAVLCA